MHAIEPRPFRRAAPWALLAFAIALAPAVVASGVYQWKDAKGVTHYSDAPPKDRAYRNRTIRQDVPAPTAAATPAVDPQCTIARQNLERLKGSAAVGLDANGDGRPDAELRADQRADQVKLAEAAIRVRCVAPAAPAATR